MRTTICLLLVLALLAGGCQPAPRTAVDSGSATAVPSLTLEPCSPAGLAQAECGKLVVPEDRAHPEGRKLELKIVVARARLKEHDPDPLFYIPGGPGNFATDPNIVASANTYLRRINNRHDIVFLDQRGTNDQHRLTCDPLPFDPALTPQAEVNDWMKQCLAKLDGDPRFYTTAVAMQDLDDARAALGYDKINLYGISYGAMAIQVYMRMFPEHYRAAVIDHGTALDLPFIPAYPRASQLALDTVFTYCEQDEPCHTAYPDIRGDWQKIRDRLAKGPVVVSVTPPGAKEPVTDQLDLNDIADGIHTMMYKSGTYVAIPSLVHTLAATEDWGPIAMAYQQQYGNSSPPEPLLLMREVIFCFEPAWVFDPETIAQQNPESYITNLEVEIAKDMQKICAALPKPDPSLIYGPGKPAPLSALMFNSRIDPQNPPSNMDLALKEFTKSRVITEPTEGHDSSGSPCRWMIAADYIEAGTVDGLQTGCMDKQKPSFVIGK